MLVGLFVCLRPYTINLNAHKFFPKIEHWLRAVCKNGGRRPGESYHVIHGTGVTCRHAICIAMLGRRPNLRSELAMKTRQVLTENKIKCRKHIRARRNSSEGLQNYMCEISAVTKNKLM